MRNGTKFLFMFAFHLAMFSACSIPLSLARSAIAAFAPFCPIQFTFLECLLAVNVLVRFVWIFFGCCFVYRLLALNFHLNMSADKSEEWAKVVSFSARLPNFVQRCRCRHHSFSLLMLMLKISRFYAVLT